MKITTQWTFTKEEAEERIHFFLDWCGEDAGIPENWEELSLQQKLNWMWEDGAFDGMEFDRFTNCYTTLEKIIVEGE